jgi:membrane associated rhomboid family serine protease
VSINVGLYLWMSLSGFERTSINFVISRQFLEQGEWWRLVSCGFVHFGIFHVAMNLMKQIKWNIKNVATFFNFIFT